MRPALQGPHRSWTADELEAEVAAAADRLRREGSRVLATLLDNSAAWLVLDEAAQRAGVVHVPLPLFFSPPQRRHALLAAGVDTLVTADPVSSAPGSLAWPVAGETMQWQRLPAQPVAMPEGTVKLTFTSGTTGTPKGVCLSGPALASVAQGLVDAMAPLGIERHLNALPYAVLLENIAGLMAPRLHGATVVSLPLSDIGLSGSSGFDPARLHACALQHQPHSLILLPQMLRAWVGYLRQAGLRAPPSLKLVAVGGAAVGAPLIEAAWALGLPACEGYGLSEGGSVQTLNLPDAQRPGSAGRLLPHARMRVSDDGELLIAGSLFSGYLGDDAPVPDWWPTGDLGRIDDDGFVHVLGRRKNVLITSFGRNVSPEWVETALCSQPAIRHAVVFGDDQPALSAVLWPLQPAADDASLQAAVAAANAHLPDYARIGHWTRGRAPFDAASGLATTNGRPLRPAIWAAHAEALASPFETATPLE
jgi:long-subunit acyl-CoA synthetase (AMP-forming)